MLIHLRTLLPLIVGDCYPGFLFLGPKMALFSKERWGCFARRPSSDAVAPILACDLMLGARGGTPRYDKKMISSSYSFCFPSNLPIQL